MSLAWGICLRLRHSRKYRSREPKVVAWMPRSAMRLIRDWVLGRGLSAALAAAHSSQTFSARGRRRTRPGGRRTFAPGLRYGSGCGSTTLVCTSLFLVRVRGRKGVGSVVRFPEPGLRGTDMGAGLKPVPTGVSFVAVGPWSCGGDGAAGVAEGDFCFCGHWRPFPDVGELGWLDRIGTVGRGARRSGRAGLKPAPTARRRGSRAVAVSGNKSSICIH